jgi:serine/threonine protein kinase
MGSGPRAPGSPQYPQFEGYQIIRLIGSGAFGKVYFAVRTADDAPVAVKVIDLDAATEDVGTFIAEASHMALTQCDHVVRLLDVFWPREPVNAFVMVLEGVTGGSLAEVAEMRLQLTEDALVAVCTDVLLGLDHLHRECHLVHRDVKGANIMLGRDGIARLSDFGAAGTIVGSEGLRNTAVGTPGWIAPEVAAVLQNRQMEAGLTVGLEDETQSQSDLDPTARYRGEYVDGYRYEADIWSLGTTMVELVAGCPSAEAVKALRAAAFEGKQIPPNLLRGSLATLSPGFLRLVGRMLTAKPSERPSATALLAEPLIAPWLEKVEQRRALIAKLAKQLPDSFQRTEPGGGAPDSDSLDADGSSGDLTDDDANLVEAPNKAYRSSEPNHSQPAVAASTNGSAHNASGANSGAADVDDPASCPNLRTTAWNMINPAIASLLRGKDVALGTTLSPDETPAVYQRSRALAGLRMAERRDERTFIAECGATPISAAAQLSSLSKPFGGMYSGLVAKSVHAMWDRSLLPRGADLPADSSTRDMCLQNVLSKLSACEAAVPGFSARFLTAVVESASHCDASVAQFRNLIERGTQQTHHVDGTVFFTDRYAAPPSIALHGTLPGTSAAIAAVMANRRGLGSAFGGATVGASSALAGGHFESGLVPAHRGAVSAAGPLSSAQADRMQQLAVVVTTAAGAGDRDSAPVDITSMLFERWKNDSSSTR